MFTELLLAGSILTSNTDDAQNDVVCDLIGATSKVVIGVMMEEKFISVLEMIQGRNPALAQKLSMGMSSALSVPGASEFITKSPTDYMLLSQHAGQVAFQTAMTKGVTDPDDVAAIVEGDCEAIGGEELLDRVRNANKALSGS